MLYTRETLIGVRIQAEEEEEEEEGNGQHWEWGCGKAALILAVENFLISQASASTSVMLADANITFLSLKTSPSMRCPAGLEPRQGAVAMGAVGNTFALGVALSPAGQAAR